jgi:ABC-2 type transport system permease protein
MRNVIAITLRELGSYLGSPMAYIITAGFLLVNGLLFGIGVTSSRQAAMDFVFSDMAIIMMLMMPALTMRLLAEEQRTGTLELLLTAPVHDTEVVLGKFFGMFVLFLIMIVPTLSYPYSLIAFGHPDLGLLVSGYIGIILVGGTFVAVGLLASSVTQNQVIAAVLAFAALLLLWLIDSISQAIQSSVGSFLSYIAISPHLDNFTRGSIQSKDIVYFLTMILGALFITERVLDYRRWR